MPDAARTAVVGYVPIVHNRVLPHDRVIHVGVMNDGSVYAHHSGVVCKSPVPPLTSDKADSHVPKAVIDSAVVSDLIAPVALMENILSVIPAPPRRSP